MVQTLLLHKAKHMYCNTVSTEGVRLCSWPWY